MISGEAFPLPTDAPDRVAALFARCGITDDPAGVLALDQGTDGQVWLSRYRPGCRPGDSVQWSRASVETPAWVREAAP